MSYIYFVQEDGRHLIKRGFSLKPHERIKTLSTGCASRLVLLAQVPALRCVEFAIHSTFWRSRQVGEWFSPSEELFSFIQEAVRLGNFDLFMVEYDACNPPPQRRQPRSPGHRKHSKGNPRLIARISRGEKEEFTNACRAIGATPSAVLRTMVQAEIRGEDPIEAVQRAWPS